MMVFIVATTIKKRPRHGNIALVPTMIEQEFGGKFDNYMTAHSWGYYIRNIMSDPNNFKKSNHTEIPRDLVTFSLEDRKNFLKGLLREVNIKDNGKYEFMSRSEKFANQLMDILRSVGAIAAITESERKGTVMRYCVRFSFNPRFDKIIKPIITSEHRRYIG